MKSYNLIHLSLGDATDESWALAWARMLAKETPSNGVFPVFALDDEEWRALLYATSKTYAGSLYFRPWEAVATKLLTDSTYALAVTEDGYSGSYRDPQAIATHLRSSIAQGMAGLYPTELQPQMGEVTFIPRF